MGTDYRLLIETALFIFLPATAGTRIITACFRARVYPLILARMYYELSKSEKKIARKVMDKGLDNHYIKALKAVQTIISKWEEGGFESNRDAYMKLYTTVDKNNNNIARIYDNKGGSRWVEVMGMQLGQGVITMEDISEFDENVKNAIMIWGGMKLLLSPPGDSVCLTVMDW